MASRAGGIRRRARAGASAALVAAFALLAACGGGGGLDLPDPSPFDADLEARLHEIRAGVSDVRGLPPFEKVKEGTISQEALLEYSRAQTQDLSEDDRQELESYQAALRLLRLIGAEDDLLEAITEDYVSGILGLYLPDAARLVMIGEGSEIGMSDELTLAHEYTHSLQDGAFGIQKVEARWQKSRTERDGHTQYAETIDCLIEGDAEVTSDLYAEEVFGADWEQRLQAEASGDEGDAGDPLPEFLARAALFNYRECQDFVQALYDEGGWTAVDAAYENPPATTEQVLHPQKYREREVANGQQPVDLSEPLGEGWELMDVSQFGEFDVYNYVVTMTHEDALGRDAAAGWGGGWISVYRDSERTDEVLVQLSLTWDSNRDMEEFLLTFGAVLDTRGVQWEPPQAEPTVSWTADGEYGAISRDDTLARVDILITNDADAFSHVN